MTIYEEAIAKIKQLPEPLVIEINDFIDFLMLQHNPSQRELLQQLTQPLNTDEADFSEYLSKPRRKPALAGTEPFSFSGTPEESGIPADEWDIENDYS